MKKIISFLPFIPEDLYATIASFSDDLTENAVGKFFYRIYQKNVEKVMRQYSIVTRGEIDRFNREDLSLNIQECAHRQNLDWLKNQRDEDVEPELFKQLYFKHHELIMLITEFRGDLFKTCIKEYTAKELSTIRGRENETILMKACTLRIQNKEEFLKQLIDHLKGYGVLELKNNDGRSLKDYILGDRQVKGADKRNLLELIDELTNPVSQQSWPCQIL